MPIRPFLAGQAFDPETITKMSAAFESVCEALSLKVVDDAGHAACCTKDNRARPTGSERRGHAKRDDP